MSNHVNSCVLYVCLLFNFRLFTVIDLSPRVLSAQQVEISGTTYILLITKSKYFFFWVKKISMYLLSLLVNQPYITRGKTLEEHSPSKLIR